MRVYKFLSAEFGLKSLWEKRLKITTIDELNDPFDLLPFKMLDDSLRLAEVIAGARCEITKRELLGAIYPLQGVQLIQARGGFHRFEIVPDQRGFREDRSGAAI